MVAKVVLITGVTRGLGRAMVQGFIQLGHTVLGCGRSASAIAALQAQYGPPHRFEVVDVSDDRHVREWAERLLELAGSPDLLLNNAALINPNGPLWEVPDRDFTALVDVNIRGVANVLRHFLPAMVARRNGIVVNFSSGWGRSADALVAPYCASKWAVEGLTKALARELPEGMAAIPLSPGIIDTDMLRSCFGGEASEYPGPEAWARNAVPYLLKLGPQDNGQSLTVGDR